jgi:hypothetical protein
MFWGAARRHWPARYPPLETGSWNRGDSHRPECCSPTRGDSGSIVPGALFDCRGGRGRITDGRWFGIAGRRGFGRRGLGSRRHWIVRLLWRGFHTQIFPLAAGCPVSRQRDRRNTTLPLQRHHYRITAEWTILHLPGCCVRTRSSGPGHSAGFVPCHRDLSNAADHPWWRSPAIRRPAGFRQVAWTDWTGRDSNLAELTW